MANLKKPRPVDEVKFGFDAQTVDVRIDKALRDFWLYYLHLRRWSRTGR